MALFGRPEVHVTVAKVMKRLMRCRADRNQAAIDAMAALCDKLAPRLSGSRRYLAGDGTRFTAADLTLAALCYPIALPECMEGQEATAKLHVTYLSFIEHRAPCTAAEVQAVVDAVNAQVAAQRDAMAAIVEDVAGNADGTSPPQTN